jgi:hypothetical protein
MSVHRFQEAVHFGEQPERIIQYGALTLPKADDEGFLTSDAGFLLRHVPDAHLQFRLTCPHGVSPLRRLERRSLQSHMLIGKRGID